MSNARTVKALRVLQAGGCFRMALERTYTGQMKFKTHLYDAEGFKVSGIGSATLRGISEFTAHEISNAGTVERWTLANPTTMPAAAAIEFDAVMSAAV
jgi:hypothetical protein